MLVGWALNEKLWSLPQLWPDSSTSWMLCQLILAELALGWWNHEETGYDPLGKMRSKMRIGHSGCQSLLQKHSVWSETPKARILLNLISIVQSFRFWGPADRLPWYRPEPCVCPSAFQTQEVFSKCLWNWMNWSNITLAAIKFTKSSVPWQLC